MALIWFAEDINSYRRNVASLITDQGHTVVEFADGKAAWDAWQTQTPHPDLLVTDIMMPYMLGSDLVEEIRNRKDGQTIPIVIESSMPFSQVEYLTWLGPTLFSHKSEGPGGVLAAIDKLLKDASWF